MRLIIITLSLFTLSSCAYDLSILNETLKEDVMRPLNLWEPKPSGIGNVPKGGTPEFTQGWEDGCHSGIASYGGNHYRYFGYKFRQDHRMILDDEYYRAWQYAYLYCRWYIWNFDRPLSGFQD